MSTSASVPVRKSFNYDSLDTADALFVQQRTGEIWALVKHTAESIVAIGQRLIEVKERLEYGRFGAWLEAEFEWDRRTAYRFISVAEEFCNRGDKLSQLNFAPSALYLLAAPSTPKAAKEEAIARAEAGESITYASAKKIKQKHSTKENLGSTEPKSQPGPHDHIPLIESTRLRTPTLSQAELVFQPGALPSPLKESPKLEILAIQHKETTFAPSNTLTSNADEPGLPKVRLSVTEVSPAGLEESGIWWRLDRQLLYCGNPNSPSFLRQILGEVKLLLAFPPTPNWQSGVEARTTIILTTQWSPQGNDPAMFEDVMEQMLLLYSKLGDSVVGCFLSHPEILSTINRLNRRGFFAEPDQERCKAVIAVWKQAGLRVEQIILPE